MSLFSGDQEYRDALRKPFPKEQIGKRPGPGGKVLDYVAHAVTTDRLNQAAPDWFFTIDQIKETPDGLHVLAVIGTMTIGGKSIPDVGEPLNKGDYGKELQTAVGNLIRRTAMRFGVAIDLWAKEELAHTENSTGEAPSAAGDANPVPPSPVEPPSEDVAPESITDPVVQSGVFKGRSFSELVTTEEGRLYLKWQTTNGPSFKRAIAKRLLETAS